MLDFRIETFLVVCKHLNFTKAAKELCITQPAVSQHIKYLEINYQTKFFHYEGKKLLLTNEGKLFLETVSTMKHDEAFLREKLTQEKTGQYHLKLGATLTIGEFILPNKLGNFLIQHPDMQITMLVNNTEQLLHQLDTGVLDFVLIEGYFPKNEYSFVPYARENFVCVAGQNYSFSKQPEILEDLLQEPLIIRETGSGTRDIFEKNLERQNLLLNDFSKLIEIGNIATIKKLVAHNLGVTALYEIAVKEELTNGSLIKIPIADLQHSHDFYFVWRKNSVFSDFYKHLASSL
ncbi:hypothetical protein DOK78_001143 [Enterococcus sp. DIV2402]|uniref:HTH lysR-type domain-containing protein n=1 Tax=Candidatus Enterococcus lowellii TaxID=2230877 RepID=A0ABZ2SLQ1_9ENTE|nr:LysR substrate-binding domain-containing protein [Enterococcus sp. DIV2402]MBO0464656.1 LysR family transcriptional regulator [Enterococcus sp. DIV2402]